MYTGLFDRGIRNENGCWVVSLTTFGDTIPPFIPAGFTATARPGQVELDWTDNTSDSDLGEYGIYRHTSNAFSSSTKIAEARTSKFIDPSGVAGTEYFYWVTAFDRSENQSSQSAAAAVTFLAALSVTTPSNPTNTQVTWVGSGVYMAGDGRIFGYLDFQSTGLPTNATYMNLLSRQEAATGYSIQAQIDPGTDIYRVDDLSPGIQHRIAMQAWGEGGGQSAIVEHLSSPFVAAGDVTAPTAPVSVTMASHLKQVSVEVGVLRPMSVDFSGLDVDFYRTSIGGTLLKTLQLGMARETGTGVAVRKHTEEFASEAYGATVIGRARCRDFSGNVSGYTNAPAGTVLNPASTTDVGTGSTSGGFSNNVAQWFLTDNPIGDIGAIVTSLNIITELGLSQIVAVACQFENTAAAKRHVDLRLDRGGGAGFTPASATIFVGKISIGVGDFYAATFQGVDSDAAVSGVDSRTYHFRAAQTNGVSGQVIATNIKLSMINLKR